LAETPSQLVEPADVGRVQEAERPQTKVGVASVRWRCVWSRVTLGGTAIMALTALGVIIFGLAWRATPERPRTTVRLTLTVPTSGTVLVASAHAGNWNERSVSLRPGLHELSIEDLRLPFDTLHIEPLDVPGAEVVLKEMTVRQGRRDLLQFSAADFASWFPYNVSDRSLKKDGYHVRVMTADAATGLSVGVHVAASEPSPTFASRLHGWLSDSRRVLTLTLVGPLAILLVAWGLRGPGLALGVGLSLLGLLVAGWLVGPIEGVTPATRALGQAGWTGRDALYPAHVLGVAVVISAVATLSGWLADRVLTFRRRRTRPLSDEPASDAASIGPSAFPGAGRHSSPRGTHFRMRTSRSRLWRLAPLLLVPLTYALIRLPAVASIGPNVYGEGWLGWDTRNLVTWSAFYATGLRPMRDFWYPYGNLLLLSAGVVGPMLEWVLDAAMVVVVCLTLRNLGRGRQLPVVLGTILVAVVQLSTSGTSRYLFPLAAVMWMASTRRAGGAQRWWALAAVAAAPWLAFDVGIYAFAGAGAAVILDELATRGPWRSRVRRLLVEVGALALSLLALVVVLAIRGQLLGNVDFVLHPAEVTAYTASITPVATLIGSTPAFVLLGAPLLFLSAALSGALNRSWRPRPWIGVLGGIGAFSLLVLSKHLVRPGVEPVLAVAAAAGVATILCVAEGRVTPRVWQIAAGVLIGSLVLQVSANGLAQSWSSQLGKVPSKAYQAVAAVTWERDRTALLHSRFALPTVPQLRNEADAAAKADALRGSGRVFVLGDAQYIYPMVGTKPYWTISVYDTSPLRQQRKVLGLLAKEPPTVVVVDRRDLSFDLTPNALRIPLIYRWVVDHYRPVSSSGPFDLLVQRGGSGVDWEYWRGVLGTTIDLNRLPAAAGHAGVQPCNETEPCVSYATVQPSAVKVPTTRALQASGPSGDYTITFQQWPGDVELHIPLGRLWFWTEGSTAVWHESGKPSGVKVERYHDAGFLY
jgi:hypothetical protein